MRRILPEFAYFVHHKKGSLSLFCNHIYSKHQDSLTKTLFPIRLDQENNLVKVQVGKLESYYYQEIILRAKKRLELLGYLDKAINGNFTDTDALAFENYQKAMGLKVTGIPDQKTLVTLFLKKKN